MRRFTFYATLGIVACLSFLMAGCGSGENKGDGGNITIGVELSPDEDAVVRLSDYFQDDFSQIELKGTAIMYICSVARLDSLVVVHAVSSDGLLLAYDLDGNFIKPLLLKGQGPDEVMNLNMFRVRNGRIYALVNLGRELWQIDPADGSVRDKMNVPDELYSIDNFNFIGDDIVFYKDLASGAIDDTQYHLSMYRQSVDSVVSRHFPIDAEASQYISFSSNGSLEYESDSTLLYMRSFMTGINRIGSGGVAPYITFAENKYTFPDARLHGSNTFMDFINYCKGSDYIWAHNNINAGRNVIISRFEYHGDRYLNFINIADRLSQSTLRVHDDIVGDCTYNLTEDEWGHVVGTDGDCFLFHYPGDDTLTNERIIILRERER